MSSQAEWYAKGTLFENCNCQVVCHGHIHFTQQCTYDRCLGYWGIQIDEGRFGETQLAGLNVVVYFDTPRLMASGDWVITTLLDPAATADQQAAIEQILSGEAGGPWKILAQFVRERRPIRRESITFTNEGKTRTASVGSLLRSTLTWLKGRDRDRPVMLENMYNQIHAPSQIIAQGSTTYANGDERLETENTHALASSFSWKGGA